MEKLEFGALLKTAFRRCVERQLSRLIAMQMLLSFLAALPFVIGGTGLAMLSAREDPENWAAILSIFGGMVLYYFPFLYFICLVGYGFSRELLYPEARIGRGLRSGFARWKVAFYPIPWFFAVVFILAAWGLVQTLLLRFAPSASSLTQLVSSVLNIAVGAVSAFLMCAVAASDTGVSFGELYRRAFTALKNGWGRYLGGMLMMYLLWIALLVPTVIMGFLFFYPKTQVVPLNIGIPVFAVWMCLFVWAALRVWVFTCVYLMDLFVDASGITPAEMGLPVEADGEAETPVTVEVPAAPETPETPDQHK